MSNERISDNCVLLTFDSVSKRFGDSKVLDKVSFEINRGDIFGFIGPNGAGKTTSIKIMVGLIQDFTGRVQINGLVIPKNIERAYSMIGYLPQKVSFQEWRTVYHALESFGKLSGMNSSELDGRITELLKLLNIMDTREKKILQLSGGTIQKVGIAQALLHDPKILILDEPLNGLDPESRIMVKKIIKDLRKNGTTVFLSSHILSDIEDLATRIAIVNHGRVVTIGSIQDLINQISVNNSVEFDLSTFIPDSFELKRIHGVKNIERLSANRFRVHTHRNYELDQVVNDITHELVNSKCQIRSIIPSSATLDEIYMKYIGGDC